MTAPDTAEEGRLNLPGLRERLESAASEAQLGRNWRELPGLLREASTALQASETRAQQAEARVEVLEKALRPFAGISPSSLYADDGSEAERYAVRLFDSTRHEGPADFTGADLAAARQALQQGEDNG